MTFRSAAPVRYPAEQEIRMSAGDFRLQRTVRTVSKHVSLESWPVVVTRLPAVASDEDFRSILSDFDSVYALRKPFFGIVDSRPLIVAPTPTQRRMILEWSRRRSADTETLGLGTAYVVPNPVIRAALAALSFLFEQPSPSHYVGTMDEALEHAETRLSERGLPLPSGLDELRGPRKT